VLTLSARLNPGFEQIAHVCPLLGAELGAVAANAPTGKRLVCRDECSRRSHGMRDHRAAPEASCKWILLRAFYSSGLPDVTLLGDAGSSGCGDSDSADVGGESPVGLARTSSAHEVEDEHGTRHPQESATLVAALHQEKWVRLGQLALEDALEEELIVRREPVQEACDLGSLWHVRERTGVHAEAAERVDRLIQGR
jgi:hypothetical protein